MSLARMSRPSILAVWRLMISSVRGQHLDRTVDRDLASGRRPRSIRQFQGAQPDSEQITARFEIRRRSELTRRGNLRANKRADGALASRGVPAPGRGPVGRLGEWIRL